MQRMFAELVNEEATPHLLDWIQRINDRPAATAMFAETPSEFARPAAE